ncbi:hypothetical protein D9757_010124 [Collybiopsis confluens]|uniref:EF-hand domain-containing protein n=1 Tax=Collybiopsis confluens TaxID=2823264 RepID=A0A8H5GT34_9AGAR|nr:hypothetical protein D9757_010124 [Collybiopsis confluens]
MFKRRKHVQVLIEISGEGLGAFHVRRTGDDDKDFETARKKLLQDFSEDLDQAFNRNLSFFERKMDMQCKQMQNIIEESLHNEGLLILSVLKAGIHDRIIDPDMKCLWKENEWKGSVKARHFVLALQDFYIERQYPSPTNSPDDRWALKYIKVSRLQPILEAIDDDGTGFISIKEVNTFVGFKPDGWSLPVWIAYWAAGWHADMVHYKRKIHAVIREISAQKTLPINRYSLDEYLHSEPFSRIDILLRSLHPLESSIDDPKMKRVIDAFSSEEERRLEENLEGIAYDIDSPGTVVLVTGPGRIERFILPLIYLMLKRHLEVFYLAQAHVIHDEEFWDLSASLRNVFTMLDDRIKSLEGKLPHSISTFLSTKLRLTFLFYLAILKQTISDVSGKLSSFAFGLLQLSYPVPATRCPKENSLRPWNEEGRGIEIPVEGMSAEQIKEIPLKILKYGSKNTLESQIYDYSLSTFNPSDRRPKSRHPLSGYWAGHLLTQDPDELFSAEGLFQISITDVDQNGKISGKAEAYHGLMTVSGHISRESSRSLSLQFLFEDGTNIDGKFSFKKSLDSDDDVSEEGDIVHGHGSTQTFVFSRQSAFTWLSLPLAQTKTARGRWVFVIGAVLNRVKRKRLTWSYIKARMAERRRFLELMVRREADFEFNLTASDPLSYEEGKELRLLTAKIHPTDARFYYSFIPSLINTNFVTHL